MHIHFAVLKLTCVTVLKMVEWFKILNDRKEGVIYEL